MEEHTTIHGQQDPVNNPSRREFLKLTTLTGLGIPFIPLSGFVASAVGLVVDPADAVGVSAAVQWAAGIFEQALAGRGVAVKKYSTLAEVGTVDLTVFVTSAGMATAKRLLDSTGIKIPSVPEALALVPTKYGAKLIVMATGFDQRGLVYALLELADRVRQTQQPLPAIQLQKPVVEQPANALRSVIRLFTSNVEDKPWYNDRAMWPEYLTMLATQRFNRFGLCFGIGYDSLQQVADAYFLFAYPFLFSLPGYQVRVPQLPDSERDSNLAMLKWISEQTVARGLQFQLGLWMHGYEWLNSTNANYTIEGLGKANHAAYCRDAVRYLLQQCPAISGITFRVHGESGVTEGSYDFWKTIFDGVKTCGRTVEIDMHAKGMDQTMIDNAVSTGLPVVISPKYWAEHMGMPYHQTDIRALEIPNEANKPSDLMKLSAGSRSFLRYGYGDLLKENRPYKVIYRIWPGAQRLLLWGDPVTAAAHARAYGFCGSNGVEWMEPLSFKGRRGSGIAGDRCGYADASLKPRWDWEKYLYTYRMFGRMLYNPETSPDTWQRYLRNYFGAGAKEVEIALANASRILPTVLTAHGVSAANDRYWPEIYTNQPITDPSIKNIYTDTPAPKTFGNVSPFDPQLFTGINDFVKESLAGERSGRYNPVEVAQWLEDYSATGEEALAQADESSANKEKAEYRRMAIDVRLQSGLGRFFGAKFRSGVLYAIYEQTGDRTALEKAVAYYRKARTNWSVMASQAGKVYKADITAGDQPWLRGHWLDRLPAMDEDLANMVKKLESSKENKPQENSRVAGTIQYATSRPSRLPVACTHKQPDSFNSGSALEILFNFTKKPSSAVLYYRHVTQAERYRKADLQWRGNIGTASIPAAYTNSPYPIQYYLEVKGEQGEASLYPGFNKELAGQPYFTVRKA